GGNMDLARNMQRVTVETRRSIDAWTQAYDEGMADLMTIIATGGDDMGAAVMDVMDTAFAQSAVEFARRQGNIPAEALDAMLGATEDTIGAHIGTIRMVMEGYYDAFLPSAGDRAAIETELQGLFELLSSPHVDSTRALDE